MLVTGAAGGVGARLLYRLLEYKPLRIFAVDKEAEGLWRSAPMCAARPSRDVEVIEMPADLAEADQTDALEDT